MNTLPGPWVSSLLLSTILALAGSAQPSRDQTTLVSDIAIAQRPPASEETLSLGRRLYHTYCFACHGMEGRGDGPLAGETRSRPRDFVEADYRIRSTPAGALPTSADLFLTITRGLPGTMMPSWSTLPVEHRWALVQYLESISPRFRGVPREQPVTVREREWQDLDVENGSRLFRERRCVLCHGERGEGDGPITLRLAEMGKDVTPARDLTRGAEYRGGTGIRDLYRTITVGFNGTPMGSHRGSMTEDERWDLAGYIRQLAGVTKPRRELAEPGASAKRGEWVFWGKGRCILCHRVSHRGFATRGPDLSDIGSEAAHRRAGHGAASYILESIVSPGSFVAEGYPDEVMPRINESTVFLEPDEIRSVALYLLAQGGSPDREALVRAEARIPVTSPPPDASVGGEPNGDVERGKQIFFGHEVLACAKCHTVLGRGDDVGPDLSHLGAIQSAEQIRRSIQEPGATIVKGYRTALLVTDDLRYLTGIVIEGDGGYVTLRDADGVTQRVARPEIEDLVYQEISIMPANTGELIDAAEVQALVSFLLDPSECLSPLPAEQKFPFFDPFRRFREGPPLAQVANKVTTGWLRGWLEDPKSYDENTRMPDLGLTDEEIDSVIHYLRFIASRPAPVAWPSFLLQPEEEMSEAEWDRMDALYQEGKSIWGQSRCSLCHEVQGRGGPVGVAPSLSKVGLKVERDWLYHWLADPKDYFPETLMPHFRFTEHEIRALVEYLLRDPRFASSEHGAREREKASPVDLRLVEQGREVIRDNRCITCHEVSGIEDRFLPETEWPRPRSPFAWLVQDVRCLTCHRIDGRGGDFAPDLSEAGKRLKRPWLLGFLKKPDMIRPLLKQMPKFGLDEAEAFVATHHFKQHDGTSDHGDVTSWEEADEELVQQGRELYRQKGCRACHQIGGEGGAVGPNLSYVADRLEPAYVYSRLLDPQSQTPETAEPDLGLSSDEAEAVTAFLGSLKREGSK